MGGAYYCTLKWYPLWARLKISGDNDGHNDNTDIQSIFITGHTTMTTTCSHEQDMKRLSERVSKIPFDYYINTAGPGDESDSL